MSGAATEPVPARGLRVSVCAADPFRRAALRRIVIQAGYELVDRLGAADVVLSDGTAPPIEGRPCVVLGGAHADQAGCLAPDASPDQIDAALRAVAAGLLVRSATAAETGFAAMGEGDLQTLLTPREIEVLNAMSEGLTNKLIGRRLDISLHTVKFHVESLFKKLGARTRTEAVAKASELRRIQTVEL